jgi:hypothetical protein
MGKSKKNIGGIVKIDTNFKIKYGGIVAQSNV